MPLNEKEIADALSERQDAAQILDRWGGQRTAYQDWQSDYSNVLRVYKGDWTMVWPDGRATKVDPSVPNMVRLAAEDRARAVGATPPTVMCYPEGPGDHEREKADKLERIVTSWFATNRLRGHTTQMWAHDAMGGGLTVCKVLPDFSKPPVARIPVFTRMKPQFSYPDPIFTAGPFLDSFIYAYEAKKRTVEKDYGIKLDWPIGGKPSESNAETIRVIEFYDDTYVYIVVEEMKKSYNAKNRREMILSEPHGMGRCPVVIGARPTMDGTYSGEFTGGLGVLDYWNKLMTMVMDDAIRKVYPERVTYNVLNPNDYGPDANIQLETPDGKYEYVQQGNQAFSNLQVLRDVGGSVRASMMLPISRSGDPNESIISAAGVSATQTQFIEDVRSIQRDIIAPMLTAAISVALQGEETWTPDVTKAVYSPDGKGYKETYVPSKDIAGYRSVDIRYGAASGLDEINQNVMVLQQLGAGIIDERTAMEMSPFVEDPQRVEKRKLKKMMQDAMVAGLQQQAATGALDPFTLAMLDQAIESDEVTLSEAIAALVPQAPLAAPQAPMSAPGQAGPGASPPAPGTAGAGMAQQGQTPQQPMAALMGA